MAPPTRKPPTAKSPSIPQVAQLRPLLSDAGPFRSGDTEPDSEQTDSEPPAKKTRKQAPSKTTEQAKPFRLMDLAAELRIIVYEKVLENHPVAKLSRNTNLRNLSSTSVLPRVSKQVRSEFLSVLLTSAPRVETSVLNCNFGHLITFLNRLSAIDLEKLTTANAPRTLLITLKFSRMWASHDFLNRWLNRVKLKSKKGSDIEFQYQTDGSYHGTMIPSFPRRDPLDPPISDEERKIRNAVGAP